MVPLSQPERRAQAAHAVQFYETESFLAGLVAEFISDGLAAGDSVLVIATPEHCDAFAERLEDDSDVAFVDASEALAAFMHDGMPDADRFVATIGSMIETLGNGRRVRAYGEMVDLLWRDGNAAAAIRLEQLWNELAVRYPFSLLCAYPIGTFDRDDDTDALDAICRTHDHVVPAETVSYAAGDAERGREIAILQHRAAVLEAEIARRRQLEEDNQLLLDATTALMRSLDLDTRLAELRELVIPRLGSDCTIDLDCIGEVATLFEPQRIIVPLEMRGRFIGAMTFVSGDRRYSGADLRLATELASRTASAIENARLYHLAQEANRTKDEFLATLSHELRTPLTAILGWARMLSLKLDEETMRLAIETIERSARAQAALIDDLLDLSRVVTGKLSLENELVDLRSVTGNAVNALQIAAKAKRITIRLAEDSGAHPIVNGDPTRLQQIIWNLLTNAIKFSEAGSEVDVALECGNGEARVIVRDRGQGISREFLPHVFEPFRQADGTSTRAQGGLGLGLAIVKYLCELHGGRVAAMSEGRGRGSTFVVSLPLASARKLPAEIPSGSDDGVDLTGVSVLLVDDDQPTRDLVHAILLHCGADVEAVGSVRAARDAFVRKKRDVVVTDIAMPDEDGFALLAHVRTTARDVPVVALTAIGGNDADEKLRSAGFDGCVTKPLDPLQFARALDRVRHS